MAKLNENGHEILDQKPVARTVKFEKPMTIAEQLRAYVRTELSRQAQEEGHESFEDADDFFIEDDLPDPQSPWELTFDQEQALIEGKETSPLEESKGEEKPTDPETSENA
jgi:hypothetical protein